MPPESEPTICGFCEGRKLTRYELAEMSDDDEEEEDDDEGDDDLVNFDAVSAISRRPPKQSVDLVFGEGKPESLKKTTAFLWTFSWLKVSLVTPPGNEKTFRKKIRDGKVEVQEYLLNCEEGEEGVKAISLFLNSLLVPKGEQHKDKNCQNPFVDYDQYQGQVKDFCDFLRQKADTLEATVKLCNLEKLLTYYEEEAQADNVTSDRVAAIDNFWRLINSTDEGGVFLMATNYPNLFRSGHKLFPKKILSLMQSSKDEPSMWERKEMLHQVLDRLLQEEPWKLGFKEIIFRETASEAGQGWAGLEALLPNMKRAIFYPDGLWPKMNNMENLVKRFPNVEERPTSHDQLLERLRNCLHLYDTIKELCHRYGHTYVTDDVELHGDHERKYKKLETVYDAFCFLTEEKVLVRDVGDNLERFHLAEFWRAEEVIKDGFAKLLSCENYNWSEVIDLQTGDGFKRIRSDPRQLMAARKILTEPLVLVSGRGGTGKTEVVTAVLEEIAKAIEETQEVEKAEEKVDFDQTVSERETVDKTLFNGPVLYAAPTGKAASVIRKRTQKKAFTIHQILASYRLWQKTQSGHPWRFKSTRVLAIDESSMVSTQLFSSILKVLQRESALDKVVLLGDIFQLPSITPGNFMSDVFNALQCRELAVKLNTNHRSEGSIIFDNADRVKERKMPMFDRNQGFHLLTPDGLSGTDNYVTKVDLKETEKLVGILDPRAIPERKRNIYLSLLWRHKEYFELDNQETSQIIAFKRAECRCLNEICCKVYNDHYIHYLERNKKIVDFQLKDKIMATKNSDVLLYVEEDSPEKKIAEKDSHEETPEEGKEFVQTSERLMNGSIYVIKGVYVKKVRRPTLPESAAANSSNSVPGPESLASGGGTSAKAPGIGSCAQYYLLDDFSGGELIRPDRNMFERYCKPAHAWALTIHKFQGSESDCVVYGVSDSGYETWQHVYTAITRAKKRVIIVGSRQDLLAAIKRSPRKRQTTLAEKLYFMFAKIQQEQKEARRLENEAENEVGISSDDSFDILAGQMTEVELSGRTKDALSSEESPEKKTRTITIRY